MINYWLWLFVILVPILVFSVKPEAGSSLRIGRLILAIALCYLFMNLALHLTFDREWETYDLCQNQFKDGAIQYHKECTPGGKGIVLYITLILGWVPATGYTGFWELIWRMYYRRHIIRNLSNKFAGKWASNLTIVFFLMCFIYITALIIIFFMFEYHRHL